MLSMRSLSVAVVTISIVAATSGSSVAQQTDPTLMMIPLSTTSAAAKEHFALGLREDDAERYPQARAHFQETIKADGAFALGHLFSAFTANSLTDFRAHLDHAVKLADRASPAEQMMIRIARRGFDNNVNGQLELGRQLVHIAPKSPRAWLAFARIQSNMGHEAEARESISKAIRLAPHAATLYVRLGNSFLQVEPRDLAKAEMHVSEAVKLEPNEPYTHDYMGDVYRGQNKLDKARAEYTRMIELDVSRSGAYQQRGHVNSFLGNFAEARADYDRAVSLAEPAQKAGFAVSHALVSVHAGNPTAAEQELDKLVNDIDGMADPDPTGAKLTALNAQAQIALHSGHLDVAERATDRIVTLLRKQGDEGGTPEFRRGSEANIAYAQGVLAARKGNYDAALANAREIIRLLAPDNNPRKNEPAHDLMGQAYLFQKNYKQAIVHFGQADPNDLYVVYHRAQALEGAGRIAEARKLYKRVGDNNFNSATIALVKRESARKAH